MTAQMEKHFKNTVQSTAERMVSSSSFETQATDYVLVQLKK